jgi:hypothetical protein
MRLSALVVSVIVSSCVLEIAVPTAFGGVAPAAKCKERKGFGTGRYSRNLLRAFGLNRKTPNVTQLASDISTAQSRITRVFTRAEFDTVGQQKGCELVDDIDALKAMGEAYTDTVLCALNPGCPSSPPVNTECKRRKTLHAGGFAFHVLRAFGQNTKIPNVVMLASDISHAKSRLTRLHTRAEFTLSGASKACDTVDDVDDIEAIAEAYVSDVLCQLESGCASPSGAFTGVVSGSIE